MKRFLKRANRGLLLSAVVLLVVIIYVCVDNARFKEAVPEIKQQVLSYLEEVEQLNLLEPEKKVEAVKELLNDYWSEEKGSELNDGEAVTRETVLDYVERLNAMGGNDTQVTAYTDVIQSSKVVKYGPGCAKATINFQVSIEFSEALKEAGYRIYGLQGEAFYSDDYGITYNEARTQMNAPYVLEMLFYENDGVWKISNAVCGIDYENM